MNTVVQVCVPAWTAHERDRPLTVHRTARPRPILDPQCTAVVWPITDKRDAEEGPPVRRRKLVFDGDWGIATDALSRDHRAFTGAVES